MKKHQFTASVFAGPGCSLPTPRAAGRSTSGRQGGNYCHLKIAKLARFLHENGVKTGAKKLINGCQKCVIGFANCIYHNHEFQITPKSLNNRNFQMINDLQRHFENADNFLRVQGCKLKMALMALLVPVEFDHINLTAGILRGHYERVTA